LEEVGWSLFGWGWGPDRVKQRVDEVLQELSLADLLWRDPRDLSGGQQQMVALAAVWARRPRYLLLDEPASRLDPKARLLLQAAVEGLACRGGAGVLWSSVNLAEVTWCDTVWSLESSGPESRIAIAPAQQWDLDQSHSVWPWPREWSRRWGQPLVAWNETSDPYRGPLPVVASAKSEPTLAVEARGLRYRHPGQTHDLFVELDWTVSEGECQALVGSNGAGKTTLTRLLRGLLRPSSGSVRVGGVEVSGQSVAGLATAVAYTFQDPANLFVSTRVDAELLYSGSLLGLERAEARRRADQAMDVFALADFAAVHPRELPAAAAALLGVALSWYSQAPVQILDEPLAHLDRPGRGVLERVLADWRAWGTTVILVAHDLDWLCTVCSAFTVLEKGAILAQGSATEVFADSKVQDRLGLPLPLTPAAETSSESC
jgi:energy-coupling factor transport system ATP-binding protein